MALERPSWQSSTHCDQHGCHGADNGNDGNRNTSLTEDKTCVSTTSQSSPWCGYSVHPSLTGCYCYGRCYFRRRDNGSCHSEYCFPRWSLDHRATFTPCSLVNIIIIIFKKEKNKYYWRLEVRIFVSGLWN